MAKPAAQTKLIFQRLEKGRERGTRKRRVVTYQSTLDVAGFQTMAPMTETLDISEPKSSTAGSRTCSYPYFDAFVHSEANRSQLLQG